MNSISANLNCMIKACEKASKILKRDFGEIEKLQVSKKGPTDFVTNSDIKVERIIIEELYYNHFIRPKVELEQIKLELELKLNFVKRW